MTLPILLRAARLHTAGIDTIRIAGCMANVCCDTSAQDAAMTDFRTMMVENAEAARRDTTQSATLATFLQSFGDVRRCDNIIALPDRLAGRACPTRARACGRTSNRDAESFCQET